MAVFALVYFAAAKASLALAIPPGYATAVWPPSGIALGVLLLAGTRWWPGVWLGAALTNYTVDLSVASAIGIATGNTLEVLCAAWLVGRFLGPDRVVRQPESAFLFAASAALASIVAASIGTAVLFVGAAMPAAQLPVNWYTWWQGDTVGILLLAPLLLAWARPSMPVEGEAGRGEHLAFAVLFAATLVAVFTQEAIPELPLPTEFLATPFFAWAACRFGDRVVTTSVLAAAAFATGCTVAGLGPFTRASVNESLLLLQAFSGSSALVALVLCALIRRRSQALRVLGSAHRALEHTVRVRTAELRERTDALTETHALSHFGYWSWDGESARLTWSDELCRIYGIAPGRFGGTFEDYLRRVDQRDRERMRALVRGAFFDHKPWEAVERIVRPDGSVRVLSSAGRAAGGAGGEPMRIFGVCVDITERVRMRGAHVALREIAMALRKGRTEPEAIATALRAVGEKLDWCVGQYWEHDAVDGVLRWASVWPAEPAGLAEFVAFSRQIDAHAGGQPIGRSCAERRPLWCGDLQGEASDKRAVGAMRGGLRSALAFPVMAGGKALGAMEFCTREVRAEESRTLDMALAVGSLLGEAIARARLERRLRRIALLPR